MLHTFLTKDVILVLRKFGRREPRHIFHQSEDRHIHLIVHIHIDTLACIGQSHLLRCADNHGTGNRQRLHQSEVNVAGSRRSIEHKIVQITPFGIADELLQGIAGHTATPQGSLVGVYKETDGKHFDAILLHRNDHVAAINILGIRAGILHLEHLRHTRTENIGIEQTNLKAHLGQRNSQIGGYG